MSHGRFRTCWSSLQSNVTCFLEDIFLDQYIVWFWLTHSNWAHSCTTRQGCIGVWHFERTCITRWQLWCRECLHNLWENPLSGSLMTVSVCENFCVYCHEVIRLSQLKGRRCCLINNRTSMSQRKPVDHPRHFSCSRKTTQHRAGGFKRTTSKSWFAKICHWCNCHVFLGLWSSLLNSTRQISEYPWCHWFCLGVDLPVQNVGCFFFFDSWKFGHPASAPHSPFIYVLVLVGDPRGHVSPIWKGF